MNDETQQSQIKCPRCSSTQLSANKKGFNSAGVVLFGVLGTLNEANKLVITCLNCGIQFPPGYRPPTEEQIAKRDAFMAKQKKILNWCIAIGLTILVLLIAYAKIRE
jgi:DNA-directed RNA polymerase subunit RPC12/RpoP